MVNIYVASSWRNSYHQEVVACLRLLGHAVYDFRHPTGLKSSSFAWRDIDLNWELWTPLQYRDAIQHHPIAENGYHADMQAMQLCNACLLVMPAGRSASFEFGWCMGAGKRCVLFVPEPIEPELMFREAEIVVSWEELQTTFAAISPIE